MPSKQWSHDELMLDLAGHLRGNSDRMVWTDMQLGPSGSPRPDCYSIMKSYSKPLPLAYECKVSVADFRSDVTSGKWSNYLKYAMGVIFAVPAGLINKTDVPKSAGLIVRGESGWKTVKGPTLNPVLLPQAAMLKLLIDGPKQMSTDRSKSARLAWINHDKMLKKFGKRITDAIVNITNAEQEIERKKIYAKSIIDRAHGDAELIRTMAHKHAGDVDAIRLELCALLKIDTSSGWLTVVAAARRLRRQIDEALLYDDIVMEIRRSRAALDSLERSMRQPEWMQSQEFAS